MTTNDASPGRSTSWELLTPYLSTLTLPSAATAIHKEECVVSFTTPHSEGGLYINLSTFESFGRMYVAWDSKRTGNSLYLHCKAIEIPSIHTDDLSIDGKTSSKPSKMTIGTAEGFNIQDASPEYVYEYTCVIPSKNIWISMDTPKCPEILQKVFLAIKENPGVKVTQRVMAWENDLKISRYTEDLPQVENPPKIPPSQWICAVCGETKNLWLNLSDGFIGCGRKLYNYGGGCRNGEEGAAILHFKDTHEAFPLAVKLGTITAHSADVFSYAADENDAVIDPKLADHLAYFGINIQKLEKTTKTTGELEIDQNLSYDWSRVTEDDQELEIVSGVGRRGLKNLGNSCYVNSILQVLCSIQEFTHPFLFLYGPLLNSLQSNTRCSIELAIQFGKLIYGLMTPMKCIDKTEIHPLQNQTLEDFTHFLPSSSIHDGKSDAQEENILDPSMIRNLIGKNHDEFSSYRQQDAEEYFSYLFIALLQTEKDLMKQFPSLSHFKKLNEIFNFQIEQRLECLQSHMVRYASTSHFIISLDIPLNMVFSHDEGNDENCEMKASKECPKYPNYDEENDTKGDVSDASVKPLNEGENAFTHRLKIPLQACLDAWATEDIREGYKSPISKQLGKLSTRNRFLTFPEYLVLHLKRFYAAEDWTARKLDCLVEVPEELDLEFLRGTGLKEGEILLPEDEETSPAVSTRDQAADVQADPQRVAEIVAMGFSRGVAEKACKATTNASAEICIDWIFSHPEAQAYSFSPADSPPLKKSKLDDPDAIATLSELGFTKQQAELALNTSEGNIEVATEWLLNNADSLGLYTETLQAEEEVDTIQETIHDGKGKYSLLAMVSHIGKSANSGHYVAHIKKDNQWTIFNDTKVALSRNPPLELGYIYLFKRTTDS